eukprot:TRINITY_DN8668_c0_g2_i2.p1 TRINITY_DN8668_c0_g2~~TRINITY_DN8668_c0_g2_i2.p1  ORF type:complete len:381 (-),score=144.04 TRINITY_DN8668_c0_g2_i2:80-1222(-)
MESIGSGSKPRAVVIDNGSGLTKVGKAGEDVPRSIFPTIIGKPKTPGLMVGVDQKDVYIGNEVKEKKSILKVDVPIVKGVIREWEDMKKIWQYAIREGAQTSPEEQEILLTECPLNPKKNREELTKIMFEEFNVPSLYLGIQAVMSLYASGRTTGLVIDSGEGITHAVPIFEGYAIPHAIQRINIGGKKLTEYLRELLKDDERFTGITDLETYQRIKEKLCVVAQDYDTEVKELSENKNAPRTEMLIDGNTISLGAERLKVPELLFQPGPSKKKAKEGIHKYADDAIKKCDQDIRKELYKNIVLAGGSTMFPRMGERIQKEIKALAPTMTTVEYFAPPERKNSAWIGGSIISSLASFTPMFITKTEYKEEGPEIVHSKCF